MADESDSTPPPKLSLSNPPWKPVRDVMFTPPLHPSAAVPFHWEEAPGKPRASTAANTAVRCLHLPPRLVMFHDDAKITAMPSPTAVLDGPYVGRSLSLAACTFSFRKPAPAAVEGGFEVLENEEGRSVKITRVRRRRSFFNLMPSINSSLQEICSSLKQAVLPRKLRRRRRRSEMEVRIGTSR